MAGSRRSRPLNLNTQVIPASRLPQFIGTPNRQLVSQPQVAGSATIRHHHQPPLNPSIPATPTTALLARPTTTQYPPITPVTHGQSHQEILQSLPIPPANEFIADRLMANVKEELAIHQLSTSAMFEKTQTAIVETISDLIKKVREESQNETKVLAEAIQKAFVIQQASSKVLNNRMGKLEKSLSSSFNQGDSESFKSQLNSILYVVEELSERIKDPDAPVTFDRGSITPAKTYVDACNDSRTPSPREIPAIQVEHATSPFPQMYTDASVTPRPETPPPNPKIFMHDIATSPTPQPRYIDAAADPDIIEPDPPQVQGRATSPICEAYISIGTDPQTPPELPWIFFSEISTHASHSSTGSYRRYSDSMTLFDDTNSVGLQCTMDMDHLSNQPQLKQKRLVNINNLRDEDIEMDATQDDIISALSSLTSRTSSGTNSLAVSPLLQSSRLTDSLEPELVDLQSNIDKEELVAVVSSRLPTPPIGSQSPTPEATSRQGRQAFDVVSSSQSVLPFIPHTSVSLLPSPEDTPPPPVPVQVSLCLNTPVPSARTLESVILEGSILRKKTPFSGQDSLEPTAAPEVITENNEPMGSPSPVEIMPRLRPQPLSPAVDSLVGTVEGVRTLVNIPSIDTNHEPTHAAEVILENYQPVHSPSPVESIPTPARQPSPPALDSQLPILSTTSVSLVGIVEGDIAHMKTPSPRDTSLEPTAATENEEAMCCPTPVTFTPSPARHSPPALGGHGITSDSENDSELAVARMIMETFQNLEEVAAEPTSQLSRGVQLLPKVATQAVRPPPLIIPETRSQLIAVHADFEDPLPSPLTPIKEDMLSPLRLRREVTPPVARLDSPVAEVLCMHTSISTPKKRAFQSPAIIKTSPSTTSPKITIPAAAFRLKRKAEQDRPAVVVLSSPIYISSRSPSPLSDLPDSDRDSDAGSLTRIIPAKKKIKKPVTSSSSTQPTTKGNSTASAPRINLKKKLEQKSGQSAAVTRVKKRKAPTMEEMEPPLKRARKKVEEIEEPRVKRGISTSVGSSSKGKETGKLKEKAKGTPQKRKEKSTSPVKGASTKSRQRTLLKGCKWPSKNMSGDRRFDKQFIECDKCLNWYHYGCAGLTDLGDPRTKGRESFVCPPCSGGGANVLVASDDIVCARPDCGQEQKQADEFFMTAIMGRTTRVQGGTGRHYMWLVKWDGYSIKDCTWEEEDGMSDPLSFIQHFNECALKQGNNPEEDPHSTILLKEAIDAGWGDPNA